jgi:hypothetical protein
MTFGKIQITGIDYNQFPDVKLQAIIRDGNNQPVPLSDLENIELVEDDQVMQTKYEQIDGGVEVMFVLDMGLGTLSPGTTYRPDGLVRNSRLEEMRQILKSYLAQMSTQDYTGIVTIQPERDQSVETWQVLTSNIEGLLDKVNNLTANPTTPSNPAEGISHALEELATSQAHSTSMVQAIIVISPGRVGTLDQVNSLVAKAVKQKVTIHSLMVNYPPADSSQIQRLAQRTNGLYSYYQGERSLTDILSWVSKQRTQYTFQYRATSKSANERQVTLRTKGTGLGQESDTKSYAMNLLPPLVEVVSPINDEEFFRRAQSPDQNPDEISETDTTIKARVTFPDGFTRKISSAQLWLDGALSGPAITDISDPNNITFPWSLRSYRDNGTTLAQIEVQVQDEIGVSSTSNPVTVKITVVIPTATPSVTATPPPPENCKDKQGGSYWLCMVLGWLKEYANLLALGIALITLALVILFRGRLAGAAVQVGDAVRQTIARITRPPQTEIGGYLTVLRGAEDLPRSRFPLYLNTVTPIGRDKRQAELVFDENAERSVISRIHCEITEASGRFTIRDLGSSHGTFINGNRLPELGVLELNDGDQIELGPVERGGILLGFEAARDSGYYGAPGEEDIADRQTEIGDQQEEQ